MSTSLFGLTLPFVFNPLPTHTLRPYQWQIGDLIFGEHTKYPVLGTQIATYNVNVQDFQLPQSSTITMGKDTHTAGPITFTMGVFDNAPVGHGYNSLPDDLILKSSKLLTALQKEWKADEIRQRWNWLKPIVYCDGYGVTKRVYGRPRKFTYTRKRPGSHFHRVTAEYARIDTLSYSDIEYRVGLANGAAPVGYTRDGGDSPSWYRVLFQGPQNNPIAVIGGDQIQLQLDIPAGVTVEVSSYPWSRRIVDSQGFNRRRALIGNSKYLDRLMIPDGVSVPMSWAATGTNSVSSCTVLWRDAYHTL